MSTQKTEPNLYHLSGHGVHVTFSTSGIDGKAHLSYQDSQAQVSCHGDEIRMQQTELGLLATVSLRKTVDTGSTSLTVLIPKVALDQKGDATIHTHAIRTVHLFSVVPAFNVGQRDLYEVIALHGHASSVLF